MKKWGEAPKELMESNERKLFSDWWRDLNREIRLAKQRYNFPSILEDAFKRNFFTTQNKAELQLVFKKVKNGDKPPSYLLAVLVIILKEVFKIINIYKVKDFNGDKFIGQVLVEMKQFNPKKITKIKSEPKKRKSLEKIELDPSEFKPQDFYTGIYP